MRSLSIQIAQKSTKAFRLDKWLLDSKRFHKNLILHFDKIHGKKRISLIIF